MVGFKDAGAGHACTRMEDLGGVDGCTGWGLRMHWVALTDARGWSNMVLTSSPSRRMEEDAVEQEDGGRCC